MKAKIFFSQFAFIVAGAFILMLDAFYNGFPYVYSDTSTYIASGFELEAPFDRPITYGIFLRIFSLNGVTLWLPVFFQALIVSWLIFMVARQFMPDKKAWISGLVVCCFLSLFTSLSWTICQLMPDIFTSVGLLCLSLICFGNIKRNTIIFLFTLYFISVAMHLSHILLFTVLIFVIFIFKRLFFSDSFGKRQLKYLSILFILTLGTVFLMGSAISKSKHVFFFGAMVEHGIVKKYLDDNCDTKKYSLCAYKDSLPARAYEFIWEEDSPFYKTGGWKNSKKEYSEIINATLTKPEYIWLHIKASFKATIEQLFLFKTGDGAGQYKEGTVLRDRINHYFKKDKNSFANCKQNQLKLDMIGPFNKLITAVLLLSFVTGLVFFFLTRKIVSRINKGMIFLFLLSVVMNAWDCGTFANAIDRLGCKMTWLIPMSSIILVIEWVVNKTGNKIS